MPNIAGILGYAPPGAYTIARTRAGTVALPGGPRIPCIIGIGHREEILVQRALGLGTEGWPSDWTDADPDGRHFKTGMYPILIGSFDLYLNPKNDGTDIPLQRVTTVDGYGPGTQTYTLDEELGEIVLDHILTKNDKLVCIYQATADFNDPELFYDPELLFEKHGYPSVYNTLSLGAQIAFENGAAAVLAVQAGYVEGTTVWEEDFDWSEAFDKLEAEDLVDFIVPMASRRLQEVIIVGDEDGDNVTKFDAALVDWTKSLVQVIPYGINQKILDTTTQPFELYKNQQLLEEDVDYKVNLTGTLPNGGKILLAAALIDHDKITANYTLDVAGGAIDVGSSILALALTHCEDQSSTAGRHERKLHTGPFSGMDWQDAIDYVTTDTVLHDSFRALYNWPDTIYREVLGTVIALDGVYLGAASAGRLASFSYIPEPLTRKNLVGFTILRSQKLKDDIMNRLADAGITVNIGLASGSVIRHGLTTIDNGVPEEEEPSIIEIRDYTAKTTRTILDNRWVGKVIDATTVPSIAKDVTAILDSLIAQKIIVDKANIRVAQDRVEPRQVNVAFDIQPVYPLNWIKIEFSIGLL